MADQAVLCEACGAPTQEFVVPLEPTSEGDGAEVLLVQRCSSLLCPTNLDEDDGPAPEVRIVQDRTAAARRA